jgi:hypothetical protein
MSPARPAKRPDWDSDEAANLGGLLRSKGAQGFCFLYDSLAQSLGVDGPVACER